MKILIVFFLFLTVFAFSQTYVEDISGFHWVTWSADHKQGYLQGFLVAYSTVLIRFYEENKNATEEVKSNMQNMFYIPLSIGDIAIKVDQYYSTYDNRKFRLWQIILMLSGKDWWKK